MLHLRVNCITEGSPPGQRKPCKIMENYVFKKLSCQMYLDKWFCPNYKSEDVTWHLSSQKMLELIVNSIIEGPLHNSCRTKCSKGNFILRWINFKAFDAIRWEKKLHQGVLELLVKCITEGSHPQLEWFLMQRILFDRKIFEIFDMHRIRAKSTE